MFLKKLIRNAIVSSSSKLQKQDVLIEGTKISEINNNLSHYEKYSEIKIYDANGFFLLPGVIDPQVHFRDPGLTHKGDLFHETMACVAGGVTSFLEMPNTIPNTITFDSMIQKKKIAREKSIANYNFFIGASHNNLDVLLRTPNVPGIKVFMGASTGNLCIDDKNILEKIFANGRRLIAVHAEDESILQSLKYWRNTGNYQDHLKARPVSAALSATQLAIKLSHRYNRRLHILHLTTHQEVDYIQKNKTPYISSEACPQHFLFHSPNVYNDLKGKALMNPPIRELPHQKRLWEGLLDGTIDCIATDNSPHTQKEKNQPYGKCPSGMPGVQTALPLLLNQVNKGKCSLNQVVKWMCESPAKLYGIKNKGFIRVGYDADIVLVDLKKKERINNEAMFYKCKWTPFHRKEIQGKVIQTFVNGNLVFNNGRIDSTYRGKEIEIDEEFR